MLCLFFYLPMIFSHRGLYLSSRNNDQCQHEELVKTSNLLFGTLEQSYIWSYIGRLLQSCCMVETFPSTDVQAVGNGPAHFLEMSSLSIFLLELLSVDSTTETQVEHLPTLLVQTSALLHESYGCRSSSSIAAGIELCLALMKKIPPVHEAEEWAGSLSKNDQEKDEVVSTDEEFLSSPGSPALVSSSHQQKQLLERAVLAVQILLAKLLNPSIFTGDRSTVLQHATSTLSAVSAQKNVKPSLEEMLSNCIETRVSEHSGISRSHPADGNEENNWKQGNIELADHRTLVELLPLFKQTCLLLKELSSFPTFCAAVMAPQVVKSADHEWNCLPDWLQLLCLACCCLPDSSSQLYLTATSVLLDLTASTSSMIPAAFWKSEKQKQPKSTASEVFAVVLLPVISPDQLLILMTRSQVFSVIARRLWQGVGLAESRQLCTELLHQLHALALPLLNNVAEEVILTSLNRQMQREEYSNAVEKFSILWHIGRDIEPSKYTSQFVTKSVLD